MDNDEALAIIFQSLSQPNDDISKEPGDEARPIELASEYRTPLDKMAWDDNLSLRTRMEHGAKFVMFQVNEDEVCLACRSRQSEEMRIEDAIEFEEKYSDGCPHKWMTFDGGMPILLTAEEMLTAGFPHGKFCIDTVKANMSENSTREELWRLHDILNRSLDCKMYPYIEAKTYRLMGEIKLRLGEKEGALSDFSLALMKDPHVGVKRLATRLRKELEGEK